MSKELWSEVDSYIEQQLLEPDPVLQAALRASADAGLPAIALTPAQAKLLHLLARIHGARTHPRARHARRLQHDLARPRAPGRTAVLVTLELNPDYAAVATANIERAGLAGLIKIERRTRAREPARARRRRRRSLRPGVHRRRQAEHPRVLRAGARAHAAGQRDRHRQRRPRRGWPTPTPRTRGAGHAPLSRPARRRSPRRPTRQRHHGPDGRQQGLRRLHAGARRAIAGRTSHSLALAREQD